MGATYAYDIECFRNLFTVTFVNVENPDDVKVFYIGVDKTDYSDVKSFLNKKMTLVGYNNCLYDDPMLRYLSTYRGDDIVEGLFHTSNRLINEGYDRDEEIRELRYPRKIKSAWKSIDLMKILGFDKLKISLKQISINLKWHKIQDLPLLPDTKVTLDQIKMILSYNLNDVLITKKLYEEIETIRELRDDLSKLYAVDLSSASDSKMANLILERIYSDKLGVDIREIRKLRTEREKVLLGECVAPYIHFESPDLQELLKRIKSTIVYSFDEFKYSETLFYANCEFTLGIGGLHTVDVPGKYFTDDEYLIQDMDVSSYYPNIIINNNYYPDHLGPDFINVLKEITKERLDAKRDYAEYKKKGLEKTSPALLAKTKMEGLKITINSIFGKMGSEFFWLLDAKKMLSTTVTGQLGLLMLVEKLHESGIRVLSCNTDGIVCKIPRKLIDRYYEIAKEWEKITHLELEYTLYKKYIRRDVNSYITEKENGETKEKGAFLKKVDLKKAFHMPIVAKALYEYFINNVPVKETLESCKDILEFCISQKVGGEFVSELHSGKKVTELQKTNRFYATNEVGAPYLYKRNIYSKSLRMVINKQIRVLNDFDPSIPFEDYAVDLKFYENQVYDIINEIEPAQLGLFNMDDDVFHGKVSITGKIGTNLISNLEVEEDISVQALNKLGKNQLSERLWSFVKNGQIIEGISPRYVFICDIDTKNLLADVYCLAKGIKKELIIDKKLFKTTPIAVGKLMYCSKFEKRTNGHAVVEGTLEDKIKMEEESLL